MSQRRVVETTSTTGLPLNSTTGIPLEGPTVMTTGLPAGLTQGLEFKRVDHQTMVETGAIQGTALPPVVSTGQTIGISNVEQAGLLPAVGSHQTFVEKIPVSEVDAAEFRSNPASFERGISGTGLPFSSGAKFVPVGTTGVPLQTTSIQTGVPLQTTTLQTGVPLQPGTAIGTQHQTFVEKVPVASAGTTTIPVATSVAASTLATTSAVAAPVLTYTGIQYDIPCYIFSWSDDLHIEIPKVAKKALGTSSHHHATTATNIINEAVYAHKGRHLPARKKRQRWIFSKEGFIFSEYNPQYVLTCFNNTVTVQRREAITTAATTSSTLAAPVISTTPLSSTHCQQWILKPSTDSNYFYICCAKNPSLAVDIEKTGELIHKGYPLVVRPLGNLSTAWSYDPK